MSTFDHHSAAHQWTLHSTSVGPSLAGDLAIDAHHAAQIDAHQRQLLRGSPLRGLSRWTRSLLRRPATAGVT